MPVRDIIVLVATLISLPFCFFRPFFGILVWAVISILNPHRFTWGVMYYQFPIAMVVAIVTLAGFVIFSPNLRRFFSREVLLIVLLWSWFTFTTMRNTEMPLFQHFAEDTWFRWGFVSKILLMTLATVAIVDSWHRFRTLLLVITGCMGFLVLKGIPFLILSGGQDRLHGPEGSMLADNNDFGLALNMTLPMFFFLARTEADRRVKWLMGLLVVLTIPSIFFTYSRGALIGMAVVTVLMILQSRQRIILLSLLMLAATFGILFTPEKWQHRMDFRREGALVDDSARARFYAWTYSWNLANAHPLTGGGFDAFTPDLYDRYAPNDEGSRPTGYVHGPHSIYFGVLAEHGFIGLFLYLALVGSCFLTLHTVRRYGNASGNYQAAAYASMLQFGIAAFMVSGAFLGRAYFDYYFTLAGCAAILSRLCKFEAAAAVYAEPEVEPHEQEVTA